MARMSPYTAMAYDLYAMALPYAVKVFHVGFVPLVLFLGMQTSPKPKFTDLLTPL